MLHDSIERKSQSKFGPDQDYDGEEGEEEGGGEEKRLHLTHQQYLHEQDKESSARRNAYHKTSRYSMTTKHHLGNW